MVIIDVNTQEDRSLNAYQTQRKTASVLFGFDRRLIFCGWTAVNAELSEQVRQDKGLMGPSLALKKRDDTKKAALHREHM